MKAPHTGDFGSMIHIEQLEKLWIKIARQPFLSQIPSICIPTIWPNEPLIICLLPRKMLISS